jgi:hypothetical protein
VDLECSTLLIIASKMVAIMDIRDDLRLELLRNAKPNTWLALSSDETRLAGSGDSYAEAVADAERQGEDDPLVLKVPDQWSPRVL